ncbi:hypothetical protein LCL97_03090 [Seohaeicola saemankumensis]|nr:hypothetical protein [Seohaeicola saemankumensis]MCA0869801.1 hypothetical protein [Seohaeicola saemankumensis]
MADVLETSGGLSRLGDLVHRFVLAGSEAAHDGAGNRGGDPVSAALRLILREIDETVLPRYLTVYDSDRPLARLVVSNRRLFALECEGTAATEAPSDPPAAARVFVKGLRNLATTATALRIRTSGRALEIGHSGVSCSASHLAAAAGLSENGGDADRLDAFVDQVKPFCHGWARCGLQDTETGGDAELADHLIGLSETGYGLARSARVAPSRPECAILPLPEEVSLVVAADGRRRLIAVIPTETAPDVLSVWAGIYRSDS